MGIDMETMKKNPDFVEATPSNEQTTVVNVDVSKNRGTPKWMVYNGKPY